MVSVAWRTLFFSMIVGVACLPSRAQLMPPAPPFPDPSSQSRQAPASGKAAPDSPRGEEGVAKKEPEMPGAPDFPVLSPQALERPSRAQTSSSGGSRSPLGADGERAIDYLVEHVVLNPNALVPGFGESLTNRGIWSVGRERPAGCPTDSRTCVLIGYRTSDAVVNCQWVVLMNGSDGAILRQNQDATHYMLRNVPTAEAAPFVVSRHAEDTGRHVLRTAGTVDVGVVVSSSGELTQVNPMNGSSALRSAAYSLARQWVFRPMTVGAQAVPYQIMLRFHFDGAEVKAEP
jgi:Gram-negative bacterial TonB protein C-terminal